MVKMPVFKYIYIFLFIIIVLSYHFTVPEMETKILHEIEAKVEFAQLEKRKMK